MITLTIPKPLIVHYTQHHYPLSTLGFVSLLLLYGSLSFVEYSNLVAKQFLSQLAITCTLQTEFTDTLH